MYKNLRFSAENLVMLTVCWLYVDWMLTVCWLYVDCMLTVWITTQTYEMQRSFWKTPRPFEHRHVEVKCLGPATYQHLPTPVPRTTETSEWDPECGVRQVLDSYWTSPFAWFGFSQRGTPDAMPQPDASRPWHSCIPAGRENCCLVAPWRCGAKKKMARTVWSTGRQIVMCSHLCCDKNMFCNTLATGHTRARQLAPITEPDRSHRIGRKEIESLKLKQFRKHHMQIFSCTSYIPCKSHI